MRKLAEIVCLALLLPGVGCGGGDGTSSHNTAASKPAPADWRYLKRVAGRSASNRLLIPAGPPPKSRVIVRDLREGHGRLLLPKDSFTANYASFDYGSGEPLERRWGKGAFHWFYGIGELVKGWEPGLRGMREGGLRELIVTSRLAYGGGAVVYLVELVGVGSSS